MLLRISTSYASIKFSPIYTNYSSLLVAIMQVIQVYLNQQGMSQAEFGRKVGVGQTMVQQWISGKRPISIIKALDIEATCSIDAHLLNNEISLLEDRLRARELSK